MSVIIDGGRIYPTDPSTCALAIPWEVASSVPLVTMPIAASVTMSVMIKRVTRPRLLIVVSLL